MHPLDEWLETIPEDERDKIALPDVWEAAINAIMKVMDKGLARVEFKVHSTTSDAAKVSVCLADIVSGEKFYESGPWHVPHGNVVTMAEPLKVKMLK